MKESTRLSAQDWAQAALAAIAEGGLTAVAVEPLAAKLGVTKGSFYAHYRNRDELVTAALDEWVRGHGREALAPYAAIADPMERLRSVLTAAARASESQRPSVQLSLLGESDERAGEALRQVNQTRIDLLTRTYHELGLTPRQARNRARIAYAAMLGLLHLSRHDPDPPMQGARHIAFLDELTTIFLPDA
ncbi:MAG TPA: TetR/AcrR family transcriptional regulator [Pseudonocardiaceae bacterium]